MEKCNQEGEVATYQNTGCSHQYSLFIYWKNTGQVTLCLRKQQLGQVALRGFLFVFLYFFGFFCQMQHAVWLYKKKTCISVGDKIQVFFKPEVFQCTISTFFCLLHSETYVLVQRGKKKPVKSFALSVLSNLKILFFHLSTSTHLVHY